LDLGASLILPNLISQQNDSANEEAILNWSLITTMKPLEIPTPYDQKIWLHAHPSTSLGTLLDNQSFRISICLRLGIPICMFLIHVHVHAKLSTNWAFMVYHATEMLEEEHVMK
jgi:hypothetical protein